MRQRIDAVYENGLLRPLEPVELADQEHVSLTIESGRDDAWLDSEALEWASQQGDPGITLDEIRNRLSSVRGSLSEFVIEERGEY